MMNENSRLVLIGQTGLAREREAPAQVGSSSCLIEFEDVGPGY